MSSKSKNYFILFNFQETRFLTHRRKYKMSVLFEKDGHIATITINRPEAMNSLSVEVRQGLAQYFTEFRDDPDLWVAIVTGKGDRAFCAGADIKSFRPASEDGKNAAPQIKPIRADEVFKPFIAAINGYALGGGLELAMTMDMRIAADHAQMGQPEINIGFMPGAGGTQRLPRFVPRAIASEMLLTGNRIDAQEAYRVGLVNKVVPLAELMSEARKMADLICTRGPAGVRASKEALIRGYSMPLVDGLKLEQELAQKVRTTDDFMEGARAFAEKRPPAYTGK